MNNFFRAIIAGYGAKKLGGGCFGTILVFVLIWVALGQCSFSSRAVPAPESYPADRRASVESAPSLRNADTHQKGVIAVVSFVALKPAA